MAGPHSLHMILPLGIFMIQLDLRDELNAFPLC